MMESTRRSLFSLFAGAVVAAPEIAKATAEASPAPAPVSVPVVSVHPYAQGMRSIHLSADEVRAAEIAFGPLRSEADRKRAIISYAKIKKAGAPS